MFLFLASLSEPKSIKEWILYAVGALIALYVIPAVKKFLGSKIALNEAKKLHDHLSFRQDLTYELKGLALEICNKFNDRFLPTIARNIQDGKITTKEDIKELLHDMGSKARGELIEYGKNEGVDILKMYGEDGIRHLIDYAAAKTSPFPGKDTAIELLSKDGAEFIINKGAAFIEKKLDKFVE